MIDQTTAMLFFPVDRDVGNPIRHHIKTPQELESFISSNSGMAESFIEEYSAPYVLLDKIFYDFDGPASYDEAKRFYKWLMWDRQVPTIPIASGKKGIHLHVLMKPKLFTSPEEAKAYLSATAFQLLFDFSPKPLTSVDTHVIGDVRRFCRIPNTLRPNGNFCTYLPSDWINMTELDIIKHIKSPHTYHYQLPPRKLEFTVSFQNTASYSTEKVTAALQSLAPPETFAVQYLSRVLRPCLAKAIVQSNPRHHTRVAATIDLKLAGISRERTKQLYSQLHWADFKSDVTNYQVDNIYNGTLIPYSCRTLQRLGVCDGKHD